MRTVGAALGAQVAATIIAANTLGGTSVPAEGGFTAAFTLGAIVVGAALVPTLVLTRGGRDRPVGEPQPEAAR
jgi:hypothetical protein